MTQNLVKFMKNKTVYPITEKFKKIVAENPNFKNMTDIQKQKVFEVFCEIKEDNRYLNLDIILQLIKKEYQWIN